MRKRIGLTRTSVLIVDVCPISSEHTVKLCVEMGFNSIWRAGSVERALRYCSATPFDVAIIDLVLGDREGEHLILALRAWPGSVDFIVAVALDDARLQRAAQGSIPADAFLQKPLFRHSLTRSVGNRAGPPNASKFDTAVERVEIE
jgi:CheY-like chemotaxis protein